MVQDRYTYTEVNGIKEKRAAEISTIQDTRTKLSNVRYQRFIREKASNIPKTKPTSISDKPKAIKNIQDHFHGISKAEGTELNKEQANKYVLTGTDNGTAKTTETTLFDLDCFKYHIKLHNRFSPLAQTENHDQLDQQEQELPFIPLPKPFTFHPDGIDVGCGHRRLQISLENLKKKRQNKVRNLEQML